MFVASVSLVLRAFKVLAVPAVLAVAGLVLMAGALTSGPPELPVPPPVVAPSWHPVEVTPVPQSAVPENDVVVSASAPIRLEIPSIGFDSSNLAGPGTSNPIQQWTEAMNEAGNGQVTPPGAWESSIVWDSTVAGGGLFGTDVQSSGRILAHTTPWDWSKLGAFNTLINVRVGDPVAITTEKGKLCYVATESDNTTSKSQLNVVYSKETVIDGTVYLITCSRAIDRNVGATVNNLVVTLQLNQQQTNTGSCW